MTALHAAGRSPGRGPLSTPRAAISPPYHPAWAILGTAFGLGKQEPAFARTLERAWDVGYHGTMIVDAHNHPDYCGHDFTRAIEDMDRCGIDITWLLSWECPPDEYAPVYIGQMPGVGGDGPAPFSRCVSWSERAPDRFVLGYCPDPRRPDAVDRLKAAVEVLGVRVCGELKLRMMYDNPDALRFFRFCAEEKLPVVLHLDYEYETGQTYPRPSWWYGGGIEALERVLRACPQTIFIGHAPGFWTHISGAGVDPKDPYPGGPVQPGGQVPRLLRAYPNLFADLSAGSGLNALSRDRVFAQEFVDEFQDRLLYARDNYANVLQEYFAEMAFPAAIMQKILGGNALRLLPLSRLRSEKPGKHA
jgi:predicted TIM-barrel fold metal-dependent hydrolase